MLPTTPRCTVLHEHDQQKLTYSSSLIFTISLVRSSCLLLVDDFRSAVASGSSLFQTIQRKGLILYLWVAAQQRDRDRSNRRKTMVHVDGHELAILGSVSGMYGITRGIYGKGWVKQMIQRQPVVAFSVFLGGLGVALPVIISPLRRKLGLPTNQYDASITGTVFPQVP